MTALDWFFIVIAGLLFWNALDDIHGHVVEITHQIQETCT